MTRLADLLATVFERRPRAPGTMPPPDAPLDALAERLLVTAAETEGLTLARAILAGYAALDAAGKRAFFRLLAGQMDIDPQAVRTALDAYAGTATRASYGAFLAAAEPRRQELIRRLNRVPGATGQLVAMRDDLLRLGRDEPALAALDLDFQHLFASWFNRGFLVLRPVNWETPALILEKIIAYEAVHAIDSWDELRRRLQPADRRCFAFFHPAMPTEPLIFVEVALTRGIPSSIQTLLADDRAPLAAAEADTAVFYSISNCQPGLAGISFGNSLIKQVAADLAADLGGLKTFVTLSPVPGLRRWLAGEGHDIEPADPLAACRLAAHYLLAVRDEAGLPRDPVARFHLGNGAQLHAVHAGADSSDKGRAQSWGVMVNYLYDLGQVDHNHEAYASARRIAASPGVRRLARDGAPPPEPAAPR